WPRQCSPSSRRDEKHSSWERRNSSKWARVRLLIGTSNRGKKGLENRRKACCTTCLSGEKKASNGGLLPRDGLDFDYPIPDVKKSRFQACPHSGMPENGYWRAVLACCISRRDRKDFLVCNSRLRRILY